MCNLPKEAVSQLKILGFLRSPLFNSAFRIMNKALDHPGDSAVAAPRGPACGTPPCTHTGRIPLRTHAVPQAGQENAATEGQGATERVASANAKSEPGTKFCGIGESQCGFVAEGIGGELVISPECPELSDRSVVAAPGSPICGTPPCAHAVPQAGQENAATGGQGATEKVASAKAKSEPGTKFCDIGESQCGFVAEGIGGELVIPPECPELSDRSVVAAPGSPICGTPPCAHAVPQAGQENAATGGQGATEKVASAKAKSEPGTKFSDIGESQCGFVPEGIGGELVISPECPELSDRSVVAAPGSPICGTPPCAHAVPQAGQENAATGGQGATEKVASAKAKSEPGTKFCGIGESQCGFVAEGIGGELVIPPECPELSDRSVVAAPGSPICGTPPCAHAVPQAGQENAATGGQGATEKVASAKAKSEPGTKFSDIGESQCGFVAEGIGGELVISPECPELSDRSVVAAPGSPICGTPPCAHAVPQAGQENAATGGQGATEKVASAKAKSEPGTKFCGIGESQCGFVAEGIGGELVIPPECPELSDRSVVAAPGSPICGTPPCAHAVLRAGQENAATGGQGATEKVASAKAKSEPGTKFSDIGESQCGFVPEGIGGELVIPPECPELSDRSVVAAPGSPICGTPPGTLPAGDKDAGTPAGVLTVRERVTGGIATLRCGLPAGKPPASSNQRRRPGDIPPESPKSGGEFVPEDIGGEMLMRLKSRGYREKVRLTRWSGV